MIKCNNCNTEIQNRSNSEIKRNKSGKFYCSASCAAQCNNKLYPKRIKENKTTCKVCNKFIRNDSTYCKSCYENGHFLLDKKLKDAIKGRKDNNRYTSIRQNGVLVYKHSGKPRICACCGYSLHIEICHIKDIASFSQETLIKEINHISNLVALCRNHHWELDHGHLNLIDLEGIEPSTKAL